MLEAGDAFMTRLPGTQTRTVIPHGGIFSIRFLEKNLDSTVVSDIPNVLCTAVPVKYGTTGAYEEIEAGTERSVPVPATEL